MTKTLTEQQIRKTIENGTGKAAKVCEQKFYDKPKSLTEQWRDGTLDGGIYYLLLNDGTTVTDKTVYIVGEKQFRWHFSSFDFVKEVLAPVPNYDHFSQLVKKVERLQEQLNEANEVIESIRTYDFTVDDENAEYYQVKWNVEAKRFYKNRKWGVK